MAATLVPHDLQLCRERLEQRRAALRAAAVDRARAGSNVAAVQPNVEVHDFKDDAFNDLLANLRHTEVAQVRDELAAIQAALRRIAAGSYGLCDECGREIGRERLLVQPSAERCLGCQERRELDPGGHRPAAAP